MSVRGIPIWPWEPETLRWLATAMVLHIGFLTIQMILQRIFNRREFLGNTVWSWAGQSPSNSHEARNSAGKRIARGGNQIKVFQSKTYIVDKLKKTTRYESTECYPLIPGGGRK